MKCPFNKLIKNNIFNEQIISDQEESFRIESKTKKEQIIKIHVFEGYEKEIGPRLPKYLKEWWEKDPRTINHAKFCLPLVMANGLGYDILSPYTFEVEWDGDENKQAQLYLQENKIQKIHDSYIKNNQQNMYNMITNHSACGSFTVQSRFIPQTEKGYFLYVKGIPNVRRNFSVMEGLIESWWNPSTFGIVCLCNAPGRFKIEKGEPIARMMLVNEDTLNIKLEIIPGSEFGTDLVPQSKEFMEKRRHAKKNVLDYYKGLYPDGKKTEHHIKPDFKREKNK